jgi:tetratricopeptide (TPR) repeat protein
MKIPSLDTIAAKLFATLKICVFAFLLLSIIFIFIKTYTQEGIVIFPFESSNENLSGVEIADQLTAELIRIQQIHNVKYENIIIDDGRIIYESYFPTEQSLGNSEIVVPKTEFAEFSMADVGKIDIGSNSLSLGNIIIAFRSIWPIFEPVKIIRGSFQMHGSTVAIVALLEGNNIQSWTVRQSVNNSNGEQLSEMIKDLAFMIANDLQRSKLSAKTWNGLKYYTEALANYHQYNLSGDPEILSLACNHSLKAIKSEKGFKYPYYLLRSMEFSYIIAGRQNDAIEYCNKTIEIDPTSAYGWINKGITLLNIRKYDEALLVFNKAIEIDSNMAPAWNLKGLTFLHMQDKLNESIEAFDRAIQLDPNSANYWSDKAGALSDLGKYNEAIAAYNKATDIDPLDAITWNNKGMVLNDQSKYEEAIQCFNKAIEIDPYKASTWNGKGVAFIHLKRYDEAVKACDKAIEIDPRNADAWNTKGVAFIHLKKYDEAVKACDKAIEINPRNANAWNTKGGAFIHLKKYDEALRACDKAIEINPRNANAWNTKGGALSGLGKYNEAITAYNKAIDIDPRDASTWNNKGVDLGQNLGKYEESIRCFDNAIGIDPGYADAWYDKSRALMALGQIAEANATLAKAYELGYMSDQDR